MSLNITQLLALSQLEGVGQVTLSSLHNYSQTNKIELSTPKELFYYFQHCHNIRLIRGSSTFSLQKLKIEYDKAQSILEQCDQLNIDYLTKFDDYFPKNLLSLTHHGKNICPSFLFFKGKPGNVEKLANDSRNIALVGTRKPSIEGKQAAYHFSSWLTKQEVQIVSGLAEGCDTLAHQACLKQEGTTLAILAHGLDHIYPPQNYRLAQQIIEQEGLLISQYPLGEKPHLKNFIERDRLISGISSGTILIQSGRKGGSMHSALSSFENHRPLWAIQYKNNEFMAQASTQGNAQLIQDIMARPLTSDTISLVIDKL